MTPSKSGNGKSARAYQVAANMTRGRIEREAPLDAEALRAVEASDIVVVPGSYDSVELVLDALEMPYQKVASDQLAEINLRPEQLLVINCPGHLSPKGIRSVSMFVARGGSLFTTDWALRNVIEPAFPGILEYNEQPTRDDVVRIEVLAADNPFLAGVMDEGDEPLWWLEGSSYPIRVLDPERVKVLLSSRELEGKYGEAPVAVLFNYEKGEVFHMISHYYLQRTETRTSRQKQSGLAYASDKGYAPSPEEEAALADLSLSDVESAASSSRLLANVVAAKKRKSSRNS